MLIVWEKKSGYKYIQIFQFIQLVNKWEGGEWTEKHREIRECKKKEVSVWRVVDRAL